MKWRTPRLTAASINAREFTDAVVAERIADRVGHDDRGGEMDDGVDLVLCNQRRYLRLVPAVTDDEHGAPRQRPIETGGEIVEHHHPLASIDERMCRYSRRRQ
jgi:hypothetical protein